MANKINESKKPKIISFHGKLNKKQFLIIQKLLLPWWWKPSLFFSMAAIIIFIEIVFADNSLKALIDSIPAIIMLILGILITTHGYNKAWKYGSTVREEISGCLNDTILEWNTPLTSAKFPWEKFLKIKESNNIILIFFTPSCAFYFTREFFLTDEDWNEFKSIISTKLRRTNDS